MIGQKPLKGWEKAIKKWGETHHRADALLYDITL